jgi:hypothetical protein
MLCVNPLCFGMKIVRTENVKKIKIGKNIDFVRIKMKKHAMMTPIVMIFLIMLVAISMSGKMLDNSIKVREEINKSQELE